METFFEICGRDFDVASALRPSTMRERAQTWRRGGTFGAKNQHTFRDSGFSVCAGGDEDCKLEKQVADALAFLEAEAGEIRRLRSLPGIEKACLRFGEIWPEGIVGRSPLLPSRLLLACGQLGLDIVLCQYLGTGTANDED